jgi:DNA-directed RNA polymerase specialized sigma subunit
MLELHDVRDGYAFVERIVQRSGLELGYHDREDLGQWLVVELWQLSLVYEPGSSVSFSNFATRHLRRRVIDWQRQRFGRTRWQFKGRLHERRLPELVSLDADDSERGRLEQSVGDRSVENGSHRLAAQLRLLDARARRPAGRDDWLGGEAA